GFRCRPAGGSRRPPVAPAAQDEPVRRCAARHRPRRPLGRAQARGANRLHREDGRWTFAPSRVSWPARRQAGQRGAIPTRRAMPKRDAQVEDIDGVRLTHPDKLLFTEAAITKADLAEYLVAVSARMLPHVSGRPLSLVRCPEGTSKECFFQKHTMKGMPPALKSVPVEEGDGEVAEYLMIDSAAGLVGAAQIGGLEIH